MEFQVLEIPQGDPRLQKVHVEGARETEWWVVVKFKMTSPVLPKSFLESLRKILKPQDLVLEGQALIDYGLDWTLGFSPKVSCLCFPRSTQQVSQILALCYKEKICVVPSGGRTGLAAGAVATKGELVLSLEKMTQIESVDIASKTLRVQAGVKNQTVQELCSQEGLHWPIDLASKGSATIGGNISTNAGGLRVIRYGHTRNWVLSVEIVLMNGEILELGGGLEKNNTGYDLKQLVIGSEGTLGVVTSATLKLAPLPQDSQVCFLGLRKIEDLPKILETLNRSHAVPLAFELGSKKCLELVSKHLGFKSPFQKDFDYFVLIEVEKDSSGGADGFFENLGQLQENHFVDEIFLSSSEKDKKYFWQFRENITESLRAAGEVYKNDLAVPVARISEFLLELQKQVSKIYPEFEVFLFGHAGDGNIHVNVLNKSGLKNAEDFFKECEEANHKLYALLKSFGGSIAAEHGIGLLKKKFLQFSRAPLEIEIMKKIKKAWDPESLLNPGKIFDC